MHNGIQQGNVGPGSVLQPQARKSDKVNLPRISHYQFGALSHGLLHLEADDGMGLRRIGPYHKDDIVVFNLGYGIRHCSRTENRGQTGHC